LRLFTLVNGVTENYRREKNTISTDSKNGNPDVMFSGTSN
jgi:hypothetical protein